MTSVRCMGPKPPDALWCPWCVSHADCWSATANSTCWGTSYSSAAAVKSR
ncbi:hypothetical protein [Streptomyces flaveolus]